MSTLASEVERKSWQATVLSKPCVPIGASAGLRFIGRRTYYPFLWCAQGRFATEVRCGMTDGCQLKPRATDGFTSPSPQAGPAGLFMARRAGGDGPGAVALMLLMCHAIELEPKLVRLLAANPRHPGVRVRVPTTPTEPLARAHWRRAPTGRAGTPGRLGVAAPVLC